MSAALLLNSKIVPTRQNLTWLEARDAVRDKGGLPSNVLHDEYLVTHAWRDLQGYYPAWAREVLVYPAKNGQFRKGTDVVDSFKDDYGREWVFPSSLIPDHAVGRAKVGLFVNPEQVEVTDTRVVILAESKSIIVLDGFLQSDGAEGKIDPDTRIPLEFSGQISANDTRWLSRNNGVSVRPLVRNTMRDGLDGRGINANKKYDSRYGVAYVETTLGGALCAVDIVRSLEIGSSPFRAQPAEVRNAISLLGSTVDAAWAEYERLVEVLQPHQLAAIRKLLDVLVKKE